MMTGGEALVAILEAYEVKIVFGIPGVHTLELYRGLARSSLTHMTPRHEQGAGFMADGYARVTGKPGVCFIITGPGMTNIATAMGQAMQDSIPMLVVSSVNRRSQMGMGEGALHELSNQSNLIGGVSRFSHSLTQIDQLPEVLARAFTVFASQRPGPVHIEVPVDLLAMDASKLDISAYPPGSAPAASATHVRQAAALASSASRPLIALGGGAVNASREIIELAEKIDAPIINTVNAKGVVPYSHPLSVGASGSCEAIRDELKAADVVLAVGTEFSETDYDFFFSGPIEIGGKLIRIDIDANQLMRNVKPDVAICSDAANAIAAINAELDTSEPTGSGASRTQSLRQEVRKIANPRYAQFFASIREALPDVTIVGDSAQPTYYAWLCYETEAPRRYFHSASGYGTLGYAIPAAIGAKIGIPNQPVIGLIGDGAAQFSIAELASAVEAGISVIFLIWNNQGYGEIRRFMDEANIERTGVDIYTPDFQMIGKGFGCTTTQVTNHAELKAELISAADRAGPTVIELAESDFTDGYPFD